MTIGAALRSAAKYKVKTTLTNNKSGSAGVSSPAWKVEAPAPTAVRGVVHIASYIVR